MSQNRETVTTLYLVRHGATEANLARPARLQGRKQNPPLARLGIRQAEATRDFLVGRAVHHCYCSPLLRAVQTAAIVAAPQGLSPAPIDGLTECDVGRWEGLDWQSIRYLDAENYRRYHNDPAGYGYPGGENFQQILTRVSPILDNLLTQHEGQSILVVGHHLVHRTYLAHLLGLVANQAPQVILDNGGISVVERIGTTINVSTLNAAFHLQNVAA